MLTVFWDLEKKTDKNFSIFLELILCIIYRVRINKIKSKSAFFKTMVKF